MRHHAANICTLLNCFVCGVQYLHFRGNEKAAAMARGMKLPHRKKISPNS